MMPLSTMWNVDQTIDSTGRSPIAARILHAWDHDPATLEFFRSSANFIYRFQSAGQDRFLRFTATTERTRAAIQAEIDLVSWLATVGIDVARPVPTRSGAYVETIETERGTFHAAVFTALVGAQYELPALDRAQIQQWGAALGQLHAALKRPAGLATRARPTWRDQLARAEAYLPDAAPVVRREWENLVATLSILPVTDDNYGLIHGDFELDNLVWQDRSIGILDFDNCAFSWFAADIAYTLQDLFDAGIDVDMPAIRTFVHGYRQHCPLPADMLAQIPLFLRLDNLLRYTTLARAIDLPPDAQQPAWLDALRTKLQNRMDQYTAMLVTNEA